MRYRILIITYKSGKKTYSPQIKKFLGWTPLGYDSKTGYNNLELDSREKALFVIDMNYKGDAKIQSIDFQYIVKP